MSLTVQDLRVYYRTLRGDCRALDGVSFEVADGEIMGLAGESGCGKTTLGKSLVRLDGRMRYVDGSVALDGEEVPLRDDRAMNNFRFRKISIVPQYSMSALNPIRKIGRMTSELLESRGIDASDLRPELERRLGLVGLAKDVLGMYPLELSGGMKQRVVLVHLDAPRSHVADRRRDHLCTRRLEPTRRQQDARRVQGSGVREERDHDHARPCCPVPGRGHDPRHVCRQAGGEGPGGDHRPLP